MQVQMQQVHSPYVPWPAGAAPPPLQPMTDALPWTSTEEQRKQAIEETRMKKHVAEEKYKQKKKQGGFLNRLEGFADKLASDIDHTLTKNSGDVSLHKARQDQDLARKRFLEQFPLIKHERFWQSYPCTLINQTVPEHGECYITDRSLCFTTEFKRKGSFIKVAINLVDIVSIRKAALLAPLPTSPNVPVLKLVDNPVDPSPPAAIQVYTRDGFLHLFYNFVSPVMAKQFMNVLDHAWRAAFYLPTIDLVVVGTLPVPQPIYVALAPAPAPAPAGGAPPHGQPHQGLAPPPPQGAPPAQQGLAPPPPQYASPGQPQYPQQLQPQYPQQQQQQQYNAPPPGAQQYGAQSFNNAPPPAAPVAPPPHGQYNGPSGQLYPPPPGAQNSYSAPPPQQSSFYGQSSSPAPSPGVSSGAVPPAANVGGPTANNNSSGGNIYAPPQYQQPPQQYGAPVAANNNDHNNNSGNNSSGAVNPYLAAPPQQQQQLQNPYK